jgi:DNA-binding NarL/FixJ family response regulator
MVTGPSEPVRVLVVDADRRVRQSLAGLIRVSDGLTLTGAVGDPVAAMHALERDAVDVVLIDPRLPEAEVGVALLGEIRAIWPSVRIVALSVVEHLDALWDDARELVVVSPASPELLVETLRDRSLSASRSSGHPWHDGGARPTG